MRTTSLAITATARGRPMLSTDATTKKISNDYIAKQQHQAEGSGSS